ncbi:MAG TPA: pyridoxamine 5'-phosphate oxidase family protein [Acidobacteriota bacterium]|nr:pyridoxamine 5'-phosphate oxidase family protein [Acidobacteriota bacterium]
MARELETRIPPDLVGRLSEEPPECRALPLISLDMQGYPHVALLSYFEVLLWREKLHFYIGKGSRSAGNLDKRGKCTLVFAHRDFVYYLKGMARRVAEADSQTVFSFQPVSVSEDFPTPEEGQAALTSGIRFQADQDSLERRLQLRRRVSSRLTQAHQE